MTGYVCPTCLRVCSDDVDVLTDEMWCVHNGVFRSQGPTIFRRDEETGELIHEWTPMRPFNPVNVL